MAHVLQPVRHRLGSDILEQLIDTILVLISSYLTHHSSLANQVGNQTISLSLIETIFVLFGLVLDQVCYVSFAGSRSCGVLILTAATNGQRRTDKIEA